MERLERGNKISSTEKDSRINKVKDTMENKKIGIITFSNGYNYGAILQAFALHDFFKDASCDPVIVDYKSERFKNRYKISVFSLNLKRLFINLYLLPAELKKRIKIDAFRKEHLRIEEFNRVVDTQELYHLFVTGSDQVWNPEITGMDDNFLLSWVTDNHKKASYAASIGTDQLKDNEEQVLKDYLSSFDRNNILVREDGAQKIVQQLTGYDTTVVCDPTLLLSSDKWKALASKINSKGYVLVYLFRTTKEKESRIIELANSKGLDIKWIRNPLRKNERIDYVNGLGIEEWLGYFLNANYVVTDSYHGMMFSLIFNKNFTVLSLGEDKSNDRFTTVLRRLDLMGRMNMDCDEWDTADIDYSAVKKKIDAFVSASKQSIMNIINGSGNACL